MERIENGQNQGTGGSSLGLIVYFSSVSEMTKNFVERLGTRNLRVPLRNSEPDLHVDEPYVMVVPSYGAGRNSSAVPKQVIKFLNNETNRKNLVGVIGSGSRNYTGKYCLGARIVAQKCDVPVLFTYELLGLPEDVVEVKEIIEKIFGELENK